MLVTDTMWIGTAMDSWWDSELCSLLLRRKCCQASQQVLAMFALESQIQRKAVEDGTC